MIALVLGNVDPLQRGRVLVAEGWAEPQGDQGTTPELGDEVWVTVVRGHLRFRKIREEDR